MARVYLLEALDDAIPLYPVYPLLFAEHGLSTAQISILFTIWTASSLVLNVPAGALADRLSRRALLAVGGLCRALAFGLWTYAPSLPGFAAGFVLWGGGGALISGTFQALVFDELTAIGAADRYGRLTGRAGTLKLVTSAVTTALAIPLLAAGGYGLVGGISVGVCLMWSVLALTLPRQPRAEEVGGYLGTLRDGLVEAATRPTVRVAVLLAAIVPGIGVFDEYVPLLGPAYGLPTQAVPVFLLALTASAAVGNWCAGRWSRTARTDVALSVAAALLGISGAVGNPGGFGLVAIAYGLFSFAVVVTGVRLQHAITGGARATVTSVADVGTDLTAMAAYALCGLVSGWLSVPALIAVFAVPLLALAVAARPRGQTIHSGL